jgi:DNA-binding response OmpR family regulator
MRIGNVEIRPAELQVIVDGRRAGLTVREFELFLMLAERQDSVVQRPEIYEQMWGGEMPRRDRSVDVLVRKIRAKLEQVAPGWRYIHTHFGIGYRFTPERAAD